MNRRLFLKNVSGTAMCLLITPHSLLFSNIHQIDSIDGIKEFQRPPDFSKTYTWWHWMNGNITKTGITLDLEAMKDVGIGGFQLFDAGTGIVKGSVDYLSEAWLELMEHTIAESSRLNLDFAMHNCPGWSSSGGPWITPEMAMQQITWSETLVNEFAKEIMLVQPPSHLDYYRDAKVIAYPVDENEVVNLEQEIDEILLDSNSLEINSFLNSGCRLEVAENAAKATLEIQFKKAVLLANITLFTGVIAGRGDFEIQVSVDGVDFESAGDFSGGSGNYSIYGLMPASVNFSRKEYKAIRICSEASREVRSVSISKKPKLNNWLRDANYRNAGWNELSFSESEYGSIDPDQVIDLTDKLDASGNLNWRPSQGNWMIIRMGHTAIGKLNHSAPETGTGLECDKFSKQAFQFHFDHMFQQIIPLLDGLLDEGKVALLIDSYEMGMQNWTKTLPDEFEKRRSYAITSYLPVLTGRIVGGVKQSQGFLYDFRRTCADLMADNYHGEFARICKELNIVSYTEPYGMGPYEEMQVGSRVDYNMGEFWAGNTVLWANIGMKRTIKLASSIAHTNNQKVVGAEAFTAEPGSGKWQQYPYSMKALGDWMFTEGLNRIIFHRFAHQPHPTAAPGMTMGPWGIHFDRTNTWWSSGKAWLMYLSRNQYLLQRGDFVADLAYLASSEPGYSIPTLPEQLSPSPPEGYDYDFIAPEILMEAYIENGSLKITDQPVYKILILQKNQAFSLALLQKLKELHDAGLTIYCEKPPRLAGLVTAEEQKRFNEIVSDIWPHQTDSSKPKNENHSVSRQKQFKAILHSLNLRPDFTFSSASNDAPVNYIHRKYKNDDYYFVANRRRSEEQLVASFRVTNKTPEIWDADTGLIYRYPFYAFENKRIKVWLQLPPSGSCWVVFRQKVNAQPIQSLRLKAENIIQFSDYEKSQHGLYADVYNNFGIGLWVKPEIDIPLNEDQYFGKTKTDNFVIYPTPGSTNYAKGHSNLGLTVGRNGIVVFEREDQIIEKVFSVSLKISGWTHLGILVKENVIHVFCNGKEVHSQQTLYPSIHPGIQEAFQMEGASYFNGDLTKPELISVENFNGALRKQLKRSSFSYAPEHIEVSPQGVLIYKEGTYDFEWNNEKKKIEINNLRQLNLQRNWEVRFPEEKGAPRRIKLKKLASLHKHPDDNVKYFSGTASYTTDFNFVKNTDSDHRYILDLGEVEVVAEVFLNDVSLGILWKPPFSLDVTDVLVNGTNALLVKVTNLWPNRLIGDAHLPDPNEYSYSESDSKFSVLGNGAIKELPLWYKNNDPMPGGERVAFTTWKHYHKNDPLLASGLVGPVCIKETARIKII